MTTKFKGAYLDASLLGLVLLVAFAGCSNDTQGIDSGIDSGTTDTDTDTDTDTYTDTDTDTVTDTETEIEPICSTWYTSYDDFGQCDASTEVSPGDAGLIMGFEAPGILSTAFCDASPEIICERSGNSAASFFKIVGPDGHAALEAVMWGDAGLPEVEYTSQSIVGVTGCGEYFCGSSSDVSEADLYYWPDGRAHVEYRPIFTGQYWDWTEGMGVGFRDLMVVDTTGVPTVCLRHITFDYY